MYTLIKNGYVYDNSSRSFSLGDILIKDGKIASVSALGESCPTDAKVIDAKGKRLTAGLIDVHTHGIAGYDFLTADTSALAVMSRAYLSRGITTVMPTLASAPLSDMLEAAERIRDFCKSDTRLCGIHLEGRYLSLQKRGAHAQELIAPLSAQELCLFERLDIYPLHISAAFERDSDLSFIKKALEMGATLGLAHTSANYAQAVECERAGVSAYTHLYNAMPPLHHRDGGPVAACLNGSCFAELICDGIHVSPEVVRMTYNIKRERLVLISDSMEATLCPDGEYSIAGNAVSVIGGVARTCDGALAGSTLTLDKAVENLMRFCNIPLEEAIISATEAPAKEMGIYDFCGSIEAGKRADILFINDKAFEIEGVMSNGAYEPI